jgi:hypothetical protein
LGHEPCAIFVPQLDGGDRVGFTAPAFLSNGLLGIRPGPNPLIADPYAGR